MPARTRSSGTSNITTESSFRRRPSTGSCGEPTRSLPNHARNRHRRTSVSKPHNPTKPGKPTSPTGVSPTPPTSKSSPGSRPLPLRPVRHRPPTDHRTDRPAHLPPSNHEPRHTVLDVDRQRFCSGTTSSVGRSTWRPRRGGRSRSTGGNPSGTGLKSSRQATCCSPGEPTETASIIARLRRGDQPDLRRTSDGRFRSWGDGRGQPRNRRESLTTSS